MSQATRLITIDTRGPIPQKSGIVGPITSPYREDVRVIARMLTGRISVTEVLEEGGTRKLTLKDIPELTAAAPKVIKHNSLQKKEISETQRLIDEAKAKEAAKKAEVKVEAPVVEAPAKTEVVEEEDVDVASMTKKERKEYYAKKREQEAANNQRQEEVLEAN